MPIPFLIAAAAVAVGGLGVVGGVVAKETMDEAKAVGAEGESIIRRAERRRNDARDETNEAVNDLGMKKLDILSGSIKVFVENFSKMKNVNFKDSAGMEELLDFTPQSDALGQLKQNSLTALEIGGSLATGVAGGNDKLVRLIAKKGEDWNAFSEADKKVVAGVAMTAKTLKVIMDTPLLHEDGALAEESQEILSLPMVQQVQALEGEVFLIAAGAACAVSPWPVMICIGSWTEAMGYANTTMPGRSYAGSMRSALCSAM